MTLREAVTEAAVRLAEDAQLAASARRDAELLLLHTLGLSRAQLLGNPDRLIDEVEQASYGDAVRRRLRREPVQYIIGQQEFYGLALCVTPAVLIPRPETEHLVEAVLGHFSGHAAKPLRIADVGTGSGAIAIALAAHLPAAQITATDISREALAVARDNARMHGFADRIRFVQTDLLNISTEESKDVAVSRFLDAVVSNPPYIPLSDSDELHPQVREHEPHTALFGGVSGLEVYQRLIPQAWAALKPGGLLALEMGHNQRADLVRLLDGWQGLTFIDDLQGIARIALAHKPE